MEDMEPLRVISKDGREWGEATAGELIVVDQENIEVRLQNDTASPNGVGYESWEDSCLGKFSEFLGIFTTGYKIEILGLVIGAKNGVSVAKRLEKGETDRNQMREGVKEAGMHHQLQWPKSE